VQGVNDPTKRRIIARNGAPSRSFNADSISCLLVYYFGFIMRKNIYRKQAVISMSNTQGWG